MRIWLISFLILLALTRGLDWLHHLSLPLPLLLLGGAILSILSNDATLVGLPWMPKSTSVVDHPSASAGKTLPPPSAS